MDKAKKIDSMTKKKAPYKVIIEHLYVAVGRHLRTLSPRLAERWSISSTLTLMNFTAYLEIIVVFLLLEKHSFVEK